MFGYLIQTKLLTKESLSLILSSGSITSFSLERYFTLKEDALEQIALCSTLQVTFQMMNQSRFSKGLSLKGCFQITDSIIEKIAKGCSSLTFLDVSMAPKITQEVRNHIVVSMVTIFQGVKAIAAHGKSLKRLLVCHCKKIVDIVEIRSKVRYFGCPS